MSAGPGTHGRMGVLPDGTVPAWWFVALYALLLLCIPTRLIVGPIGAAGSPAALFSIVLLLWWICALLGGQLPSHGLNPLRTSALVFAALVFISYATGHLLGWYQPADIRPEYGARLWRFADVPEMTRVASSAADRGLLALAGWIGLTLFTAEGIRSWRELNRLLGWIVAAGSFVAVLGIVQYFTGMNVAGLLRLPGLVAESDFGNALSRSDLNRVVSTSTHPIELGVVMASMLPLAIHVGLRSKVFVGWIPTITIGLATLMSVSRSGIVVAAVAMVIVFFGWPLRIKLTALISAVVLGAAGPLVLPGLLGTIRALFTNLEEDPSIAGRTDDYGLVLRMVAEQPWFGRGLFTWVPMVYRTIDNQALVLLLEIGILGTIAFLVFVCSGLVQGVIVRLRASDPEHGSAGLAITAALAGVLVSYLTFDALGFRQVTGLTFLFTGLAGAVWNLTRAERVAAKQAGRKKWGPPAAASGAPSRPAMPAGPAAPEPTDAARPTA